ncbi:MAG: GlcG/HbpS family heme-binding protein [Actinomycetes bacterium]
MITIRRLDLADAQELLDAAAEKAREIGVPMCTAVADEAGNLLAFSRMDGGKVSSISIAIDKAFTAAAARNDTSFYGGVSRPGEAAWGINQTNGGRFCVIGGGMPLVVEGVIVGGIGVSSGTAAQDEQVAESAVERWYADHEVSRRSA